MADGQSSDPELVQLIQEKARQLGEGDYFVVLGVPEGTEGQGLREAYFQLARKVHPDAIAKAKLGEDMQRKAVEVFRGLAEAYAVLSDRRRRIEYLARRAQGQARPMSSQEKVQRDAQAEARIWFNKGTTLMQRRAVAEAEASLRRAVELAPNNGRYAAFLAWAVMNNDQRPLEPRLDEARRWLAMAAEKADADTTGDTWYFQSMWHKFRGEEKEQQACLALCLEQNPRHVDALREQRLLTLRSRKRPASPLEQSLRGLWSRLTKGR